MGVQMHLWSITYVDIRPGNLDVITWKWCLMPSDYIWALLRVMEAQICMDQSNKCESAYIHGRQGYVTALRRIYRVQQVNPDNFLLVAKILISQEILKIKLWNFVSLLRIQMGQIFHSIWPPLANMRFSGGLQIMETPWVISAISNDLTAFLMSSLRAVMLLCELSHALASICM